ncbi:hypothetical protein ARMGADRAFT_675257 [Armillaria gallica]|uniref:Uncharacterized protein n=1 Tax=Armillaria gallica TaxID=47427 RepID=A0A2H3CXU2_ARMGA|nr:hypothetical protein ARMGADRAFT_675257 [Armillaria gallica]
MAICPMVSSIPRPCNPGQESAIDGFSKELLGLKSEELSCNTTFPFVIQEDKTGKNPEAQVISLLSSTTMLLALLKSRFLQDIRRLSTLSPKQSVDSCRRNEFRREVLQYYEACRRNAGNVSSCCGCVGCTGKQIPSLNSPVSKTGQGL